MSHPSRFYAGIGSRATPAAVLAQMTLLAGELGDQGWVLRSGAAEGADQAFESGLDPGHAREIYLPWRGFSGHVSALCAPTSAAFDLAADLHPAWARCSHGARKLHARNCHQILGLDLATPAAFVLCWTKGGEGGGGTGQALRLARREGVPIFDFGSGPGVVHTFRSFLKSTGPAPSVPSSGAVKP